MRDAVPNRDEAPTQDNNEILDAIERSAREVRGDITSLSDRVTKQLTEIKTEIEDLKEKTRQLETNVEFQEADNKEKFDMLDARMTALEFHSRKYNLIFQGLKSKQWEEETAVKNFIKETLQITTDPQLANVHSLDSKTDKRLIICRFTQWKDREACVFAARKKLKGTAFSVVTDLPVALRSRRTELLKQCRKMREEKMQARVIEKGMNIILQTRKASSEAWKKVN